MCSLNALLGSQFLLLQDLQLYPVNGALKDLVEQHEDKCVPYAAVSGYVKADSAPIISPQDLNKNPTKGVIHCISVIEYKTEWNKSTNSW